MIRAVTGAGRHRTRAIVVSVAIVVRRNKGARKSFNRHKMRLLPAPDRRTTEGGIAINAVCDDPAARRTGGAHRRRTAADRRADRERVRGADLREQRRPVALAKPTLLLHDPGSQSCAGAIVRRLGPPWRAQAGSDAIPRGADADAVQIRKLPAFLTARPGVIELWLPVAEPKTSGAAIDRDQPAGVGYP